MYINAKLICVQIVPGITGSGDEVRGSGDEEEQWRG
jgi:hypothetical protein